MSLNLYDNAFKLKLNNWTKNTELTILGPEETAKMFSIIADKTDDKPIKLPIISIKRTAGFTILDTAKRNLAFDGLKLEANYEKAKQLNAIPISIPYQLDIYTRYQREADELVRNIVFNIINYPKLDIIIPYHNDQYIHHSNIRLSGSVDDNSSIPERLIPGQFTRLTLPIIIDDAYLFDIRYNDTYTLEITTQIDEIKDAL